MTAPNSVIMTVGTGGSRLVDEVLADRHHVIAVDLSQRALDRVQERVGPSDRLRLIHADVRNLRLKEQVDAWHDRAVFHFFTSQQDQAGYASAAARIVRSGGYLTIATFAPTGPNRCSGLPTARHDADSLAAIFGPSFELIESFEADHVTPWNAVQRFTHGVLRRV